MSNLYNFELEDDQSPYDSISDRPALDGINGSNADRQPGSAQLANSQIPAPSVRLDFAKGLSIPGKSFSGGLPTPMDLAEIKKDPKKMSELVKAMMLMTGAGSGQNGAKISDNQDKSSLSLPTSPVAAPSQSSKPIAPPSSGGDDANESGLLKDYARAQLGLLQNRITAGAGDDAANYGLAAAQAAQGPQTPQINTALYNNMQTQSTNAQTAQTADMARRASIINAIEQRRQAQAIASQRNANQIDVAKIRTAGANNPTSPQNMSVASRAANTLMNAPTVQKEVFKLNGSLALQSLNDAVKRGDLNAAKSIAHQYTNMISQIEGGGNMSAQDRANLQSDSAYQKLKEAYNYYSGDVTNVVPPKQLAQIMHEGKALGDRAAQSYHNTVLGQMAGADTGAIVPGSPPGAIHSLMKNRHDVFLKANGYNPDGSPIDNSSSQSQSPKIRKFVNPKTGQIKYIDQNGQEVPGQGQTP